MGVLKDKTIVVGVCGGIAAYKAAELVRLLTAQQVRVRVMMSRNAAEFITPLTLQTLSANPVATDTFNLTEESEIGHIRLADTADAIVIAPASADVIAKAAVGIADDIVTTVLLASSGDLACGYQGKGRLPDPAAIVEEVERMLSPHDLAAERILVTAGPTQEMIDPVRFVSNRSTGKMGFAIARAAWRRGARVRLIAGPSPLGTPYGSERIDTVSATEMLNATARNFPWSTALVMAAAVADFRPTHQAPHKIKKNARGMTLELEGIADEMPRLSARKGSRIVIGFAAETQGLEENAADKLRRKRLDFIVANDVSRSDAGFAVDTNVVTIIGDDGRAIEHPKLSKDEVAEVILDRLLALRTAKSGRRTLRAVR